MKKIRNIILILFLSLGLSCGDDFVDTLPIGASIPENTDDLAMLINVRNNVNTGGNNFTTQCDDYLIPDDNKAQYDKSYTWQDQIYTEVESDEDWNKNYKIISIANFVLNHIDNYPQGDMFKVENTKGRALFLRANAYFYLVNGYAKTYNAATAVRDLGVPMPLEMDISVQLPRSTVQQGYDLIVKDLNQAIPLLDATSKYQSYWSCKAAAYALLGRVYLYQKTYAKSAQNSKQALDLYSSLLDYNTIDYADPKSKNPAAGITGYDSTSNQENLFISNSGSYLTEIFCSKSLINVFDKNKDLRYRYFIADRDQTGISLKGSYIPVNANRDEVSGITTPEVYLNYAEALMRQSPPQTKEALTWLNKLRKNRYDSSTYMPYTSSDPSEVLKEVMLERRRELRFTAWRWFDMKRLGVEVTRTVQGKTYTLKATSNNYIWAIPPNVMAMNPLLKQNPRGL